MRGIDPSRRPHPLRRIGHAVARFWHKAYGDGITGLAAMVAYNLLLSIFPVALIALFVAGHVLRSPDLEQSVLSDLQQLFPSAADSTLRSALNSIQNRSTATGLLALAASVWIGASFWGALDTAFGRIYGTEGRPWIRQKIFALSMLVVVFLFFVATLAVPAAQSILARGARGLPFGLSEVRGVVFTLTLVAGLTLLFATLCLVYWRVPRGAMAWRQVWPGALGATLAIGAVDYAFPLYLSNISTLAAVGPSVVFALIALVWFYVIALIMLSGAVVNALRGPVGAPVNSP
ncbi:YihY/virulence factor BrkB family protein [Paraconexibacter sp.]|uniref:YihY/virulence factor BrkB family protein n=1 Tax=Paraconexibacter sp. TaxID=2949640 RepID=UPI00356376AA